MVDSTIMEKDADYLVPRLRDLAFSVDIRQAHHSLSPESFLFSNNFTFVSQKLENNILGSILS